MHQKLTMKVEDICIYLRPIEEGLIRATATKLNVSITFWKSERELSFLCRNRSG